MRKIKILVLIIAMFLCSVSAYAAVPRLINYQGRLTDSGGTPLNGSYAVTFRIYDAATAAGNLLWQETYGGLVIQKGIFSVLLGSVTALSIPFDKQYYLAVQIASDPEMSPRQQIAASAYAIRAEEAERLGGKSSSDYALNTDITTTPVANKAVKLDTNAKLPISALKTYDSGWFAVTEYTGYTKTHNLGTTKVMTQIYISSSSDGSADCVGDYSSAYDGGHTEYAGYRGVNIAALTSTTVSIRIELLGWDTYKIVHDVNGNSITPRHARIVMLALE